MKKLLGLLIVILSLSLASEAQEIKVPVVVLPDSIALRVMEDLLLLDHLKVKAEAQDSIIRVYESKDINYQNVIASYQVSEQHYKVIVANLNSINQIQEAKLKDQKKAEKQRKRRTFVIDVIQSGLIIFLIYSITQS